MRTLSSFQVSSPRTDGEKIKESIISQVPSVHKKQARKASKGQVCYQVPSTAAMKVIAAIAALLLVVYVTGARFPSSVDDAALLLTNDAQAFENGFDLVRRANIGATRTLKGGDDGKKGGPGGGDMKKGDDQKKGGDMGPKIDAGPQGGDVKKAQPQPDAKKAPEQKKGDEMKKGDMKKGDDLKKAQPQAQAQPQPDAKKAAPQDMKKGDDMKKGGGGGGGGDAKKGGDMKKGP